MFVVAPKAPARTHVGGQGLLALLLEEWRGRRPGAPCMLLRARASRRPRRARYSSSCPRIHKKQGDMVRSICAYMPAGQARRRRAGRPAARFPLPRRWPPYGRGHARGARQGAVAVQTRRRSRQRSRWFRCCRAAAAPSIKLKKMTAYDMRMSLLHELMSLWRRQSLVFHFLHGIRRRQSIAGRDGGYEEGLRATTHRYLIPPSFLLLYAAAERDAAAHRAAAWRPVQAADARYEMETARWWGGRHSLLHCSREYRYCMISCSRDMEEW